MSNSDIWSVPIAYLPNPPTTVNFVTAWEGIGFNIYFQNSLFIAIVSVIIITFFSVFVGYSLSRFKFKGKNAFMFMMLTTQFLPVAMLILPLFFIFRGMGLLDNPFSLIIINTTMQLSFNSILMRGFISGIPVELEEASWIDGCGKIGAIFRMVLPLLLPGLVATAAFSFVGVWNEFLFAFMFMTSRSNFTLPIGLRFVLGEYGTDLGALAAGSIIALVPALLMFIYLQKYLISGLAAGSVKG
jgi:multiple sugar transport system permease protein